MPISHQEILDRTRAAGIIPVFNHPDLDIAKAVLDHSYAAGVRVFEFTNREKNAFEVFKALRIYAEKYPDMLLGIGTVFTKDDAQRFLYAGTDFVVSPAMLPEVGVFCRMKQVFWVPGCATLTEVFNGKTLGAKLVKTFPGNLLGPAFIKAVHSVIPDIKLMPTGGVEPTEANLKDWFSAGVHCVGMGSQLIDKKEIEQGDFDGLKRRISQSLEIIKSLRK